MNERKFQPGVRLSMSDLVVLLVSGIAVGFVSALNPWWGVAIAFVVLHFFLFCNVLRISRRSELIWAAVFLVMATVALSTGILTWPLVLGAASLVTVVVAVVEMRHASYHGIAWQILNPRLPDWWAATISQPRVPPPGEEARRADNT